MSKLGAILLASALAVPALAQESAVDVVTAQAVESTDRPGASKVLSLADVLREALQKNPRVQSALHTVQAQRHKVPQVKSLPDPEASVGWMGNLAPFSLQEGDPSSYRGIGVMQSIPPANVEPAALTETLDDLYVTAKKHDPGLQQAQVQIARNQLATDLARKDYRPDFQVAYMFQQRSLLPDMNGMTFTVNVPVFYKTKQREAVKQATEEVLSAEQGRDNRVNELQFELKQQYLAAQAAKQLLDLYSKAVVPQSSLALESSMSAYEVGNVDFLTMLANFTTVLNYEVDYYRQLADYQIALARMEPLVGMELTSAPGDVSSEK
jgi:outer membrane protein TolC